MELLISLIYYHGVYEIREETYDKYVPQNVQKVTIISGQTSTVTFDNVLKRGSLQIIKNSEDNMVEGIKFHLYGTSLSGLQVDEYAVTDNTGIAKFDNILISGNTGYTLEEVDTELKYVIPEKQVVSIKWNEVTNVNVINELKKFNVTVTKTDMEKSISQGNASLAGAKYGIYNNGELVDVYYTDNNGQFTTKYYICGDAWTVQEIEPSEGYLLNDKIYHIGSESEKYILEYNTTEINVTEQVKKGSISIMKHSDDGKTQIETPEVGAEFEVYLKSSGSYQNAKDTEKDILVCDENGFAKTKDLPYGIYRVHQTKSWNDREVIEDFDVYIADDQKTYNFIINNAKFESYLKIVKKDAETLKTIPLSGTAFQIYNSNKELISMTYTYPQPTTIDTFYTNEYGFLVTPNCLESGDYYIKEVQAPYGYVINNEFIPFTITQSASKDENGVTVIEVNAYNIVQKGKITIEKSGEVFYTVLQNENIYQPVYEVSGLEGAVYEIIADEDIYTQDGTLKNNKGDVVDTITTLSNGVATSRDLYLGKYKVKEIQAPYGMIINTEVYNVELNYAGQEVDIIETSVQLYNERQKVEISLNKFLEEDLDYEIGKNGEIFDIRFGLYATEDILAKDGTKIPKDGLIEIITINQEGKGVFKTDLPFGKYYLKEISTNEAYKLIENKYDVIFEYTNQEENVVEIIANNGEIIKNDLIRGKIVGKKLTEDGDELSSATIGIFKPGTTDFTLGNAIKTVMTGTNGTFEFDNVPYGNWIIREIESPEGFILSEEEILVTINENNQIIEIELINYFIRGNVELTKVDENYPDNKLSEAIFEVFRDSNNNKKLDQDDKFLGNLNETEIGIYKMNGIKYGLIFIKEKEAPYGFIKDENVYAIDILENGKTYIVENEIGTGCFINKAMKGSIKINKKSEDGILKGFTFIVFGVDFAGNTFNQSYVTDENGQIFIENLRIGKYTISELETEENSRYIIPVSQEIDVKYKEVTEMIFENKLKDTPNTGDTSYFKIWITILIISSLGLGFVIIKMKNK